MSRLLRLILWVVGTGVVGGLSLWVMDWILDDFVVGDFWDRAAAAVIIAGVTALAFPLIYRVAALIHPLLFPVLIFPLTALLVQIAARIDDWLGFGQIEVHGWETAVWVAIGTTFVATFMTTLFSLDDDLMYHRLVTDSIRSQLGSRPRSDEPGFMFLEIDGLSGPVLEEAMAKGYAPTMKRWRDSGTHGLTIWEPDLSSQTSASQAGLLLGNNFGIPAFRWWDKPRQELMVSSKMSTARQLEQDLDVHHGLLAPDGASRFNVFTGGAADNVGVFSSLSLRSGGSNRYFAYMLNPFMLGRLFSRFLQDVVREWWEEMRQKQKHVEPFLNRPWSYAFTRAGTTAAMMEATRFMVTADLLAGVPSAYHLILGYDEMAHHTGINDPYTLKVLHEIDRMIASFEEVLQDAPRPYHLVVLSDHGQSYGATFLQRYGVSLAQLVQKLVEDRVHMTGILDSQESMAHVEATLTEATSGDSRTAKLTRRGLQGLTNFTPPEEPVDTSAEPIDEKVGKLAGGEGYVLASGNLGLISFTQWKERMTYEQIVDAFPGLISGLVQHEGIGFIMLNSEEQGPLAIGSQGIYFLRDDTVENANPIEKYGELAPYHLRRHDSMPNCPDILVISEYWPETGQVAAFEELIGNHGGLGGWQREPFILHPVELAMPDQLVVGPAALNEVMRRWIDDAQPRRAAIDHGAAQEPAQVADAVA